MAQKKKETPAKKTKKSLFSKMMLASPEGHKMSLCLQMSGIPCDIQTGELIYKIFKTHEEMGEAFDLRTACKLRADNETKFAMIG